MANEDEPSPEARPVTPFEFERALLAIVRERRADADLRRFAAERLAMIIEDRQEAQQP